MAEDEGKGLPTQGNTRFGVLAFRNFVDALLVSSRGETVGLVLKSDGEGGVSWEIESGGGGDNGFAYYMGARG